MRKGDKMSEKNKTNNSIWRNSIFMRIFASYSVSIMGNYFDSVALMIMFGYLWQAEPIVIAFIPVAVALPQAILSQFTGVLADKMNKVKLMLVSDLLTALLTLLLLWAASPWIALLLISLRSTVNVVHFPAQQSLIKHVVPEQQLIKAVSLNGMVMQLSKIIAPLLGGILAGATSPQVCILLNAIAFFISSVILMTLVKKKKITHTSADHNETDDASALPASFWQSWKEGWGFIFRSRILKVSFLLSFIGLSFIQMIDVQFTTWLRVYAPERSELIGWIFASSGFGALMMMMFLNRFEHFRSYGTLLGGSILFIGAGFGGFGFLTEGFAMWLPVLLGIFIGLGVGLYSIGFQYIIQKHTTEKSIGRVSGISNSISSMTVVIAPLIGGMLVQKWGPGTIFLIIGVICTLVGLAALLLQKVLWKESKEIYSTQEQSI